MPTAELYRIDNDLKLTKVLVGGNSPVSVLEGHSWKFFIPIPPKADERHLLAFSNESIALFTADADGVFQETWTKPAARKKPDGTISDPENPRVEELELHANICAGKLDDDSESLIDLVAQSEFPDTKKPASKTFSFWNVKVNALEKSDSTTPDFPWDDSVHDRDVQHLIAGNFYKDSGSRDDLFLYQGSKAHKAKTGTARRLNYSLVVPPVLTKFRATWSKVIPCPFPPTAQEIADGKFVPTHVLFFDDGRVVTNHRSPGFVKFPYRGRHPMAPWAEIRRPRGRGHLTLANVETQPDPGLGPKIRTVVDDDGKRKPLTNRLVVATPSPFLSTRQDLKKKVNQLNLNLDDAPENLDWWNGGRLENIHCQLFFGIFPRSGYFLQTFSRPRVNDQYRVLDRSLQIIPPDPSKPFDTDIELSVALPPVVVAGDFVKADSNSELLFYTP